MLRSPSISVITISGFLQHVQGLEIDPGGEIDLAGNQRIHTRRDIDDRQNLDIVEMRPAR